MSSLLTIVNLKEGVKVEKEIICEKKIRKKNFK